MICELVSWGAGGWGVVVTCGRTVLLAGDDNGSNGRITALGSSAIWESPLAQGLCVCAGRLASAPSWLIEFKLTTAGGSWGPSSAQGDCTGTFNGTKGVCKRMGVGVGEGLSLFNAMFGTISVCTPTRPSFAGVDGGSRAVWSACRPATARDAISGIGLTVIGLNLSRAVWMAFRPEMARNSPW